MRKMQGRPSLGPLFLWPKTSVLRRIAGRPAALPQNCLTTEDESRTTLSLRPRHFGNLCSGPNISFIHSYLEHFRNLNAAASSNTFARIEGLKAGSGRDKFLIKVALHGERGNS